MKNIFPEPIAKLPEADIPFQGATAYLSQSDNHQTLFMQFDETIEIPEHMHAAQIGFVLEGEIELTFQNEIKCFKKGDRYHIPAEVKHSAKIYAGYADITVFMEPNRYKIKSV
jgi:quercetin dioxygenase-like cupin family protein